jgi:hypothetical protein
MKTYVIAGNRYEALAWIKESVGKRQREIPDPWWAPRGLMSDYVIVEHVDQLCGIRDPHGVFIGHWRNRSNIKELVVALLTRSTHENKELERIRKLVDV